MKKDFLDKVIDVGDKVVCLVPNYRDLVKATVIKIHPKLITVEYLDYWKKLYTYRIHPATCVRIDKEE